MSLRLKICRDTRGTWNMRGLPQHPLAQFPSLSASLDYARRECAAAPATIELVIDGFYAVVHQEGGWPRRLAGFDVDHPCPVGRRAGARGHHRDPGSVTRLRSSWFIKWRDAAIRSIAARSWIYGHETVEGSNADLERGSCDRMSEGLRYPFLWNLYH